MATANAATRKKQLEDMRQGIVVYGESKDSVRGLLSDLRASEALIIVATPNAEKINLRMGDVSYSTTY